MTWGAEDHLWLLETLELAGRAYLVLGVTVSLTSLILYVVRGTPNWLKAMSRRRALVWMIGLCLALYLGGAAFLLVRSENSPLSIGNKCGRAILESVRAFEDRRFADAESLGKTAVEFAEQLEPGDERLRGSLQRLVNYCIAQDKWAEAEGYQRRCLEVMKASASSDDPEVLTETRKLAVVCAAQWKDPDGGELVEENLRRMLPEADRRAIRRLGMELAYPEKLLTTRTSVEELEAKHRYDGKPFGNLNPAWNHLKTEMTAGDEIWNWSTSPATWAARCGREGVALVRKGRVVETLITEMN